MVRFIGNLRSIFHPISFTNLSLSMNPDATCHEQGLVLNIGFVTKRNVHSLILFGLRKKEMKLMPDPNGKHVVF